MSELRRRFLRPSHGRTSPYSYEEVSTFRNTNWTLSPVLFLVLLFTVLAFLLSLSLYFSDSLPAVPSSKDKSSGFSAHHSFKFLNGLADIGPKVVGSYENEEQAVNYITNIVSDIMVKSSTQHNITIDQQKASGEFSISFLSKHIELVYRNVQNVIVKIGPKTPSDKSLLLNCHFDSVPMSPGASDDGLNCAVLLEVFRVLAVSSEILPHNIIFLFNGAEESPLLASHGFITQHKWAQEVKAFINLESCGAGGREILFQAGPNHPWLIQSYATAAKHPSGCVVAEEIFQFGLVPSDTDFRIFRDFGGKPGLDFAHSKNGFVYHTKLDNVQSIDNVLGVMQHTGENILSLVKTIIKSKEFENPDDYKYGKQVYFDLFGIIFINYSTDFGKALNSIAVILAIGGYYITAYFTHSWSILRNFCPLSSTIMYGSIVLSLVYNVMLAYFLDVCGITMSWYTYNLLIIPIYVFPTIIIMLMNLLQYERYDKSKAHINMKLKSQCLSVLLFWTTILFLSTFFNVRSTYLLMILVLPPAIYTFSTSFMRMASNRLVWTILFLVSTVPGSLYLTYLGISSFRLFIPVTGRFGAEKNPEYIISVLATLFSSAIFSYITIFVLAVRRRLVVINILAFLHFFTLLCIAFLPALFPFSPGAPQRVLATHVNRKFYLGSSLERSDSLFWIQNMDRRGRNVLEVLHSAPSLDKFCEKDGYCGLPWYSKFQERSASTCISSAPHNLPDDTHMKVLKKTFISKTVVRFQLNITGPDHMGIILTPKKNCSLKSWNLPGTIHNQSQYMIGYVHGLPNSGWDLNFDLLVPEKKSPEYYVDLEVYGLYFHHKKYFLKSFIDFLLKFPEWSHVSHCLSIYKHFTF